MMREKRYSPTCQQCGFFNFLQGQINRDSSSPELHSEPDCGVESRLIDAMAWRPKGQLMRLPRFIGKRLRGRFNITKTLGAVKAGRWLRSPQFGPRTIVAWERWMSRPFVGSCRLCFPRHEMHEVKYLVPRSYEPNWLSQAIPRTTYQPRLQGDPRQKK